MTEYEEAIQGFKSGEWALNDDEYLDDEGLPCCKNCKTRRVYVSDDKRYLARCICDCQRAALQREEEERQRQEHIAKYRERLRLSMIGDRYKDLRLVDARETDNNRVAIEKARAYIANAKEMRQHNIGLYFYGDNSSGKTYITACICNELLYAGWRCVYTNLATILGEIRGSYDGDGMGENDIMRRLQTYDFVFLDDFGKEFIGREFNSGAAKWSEEKLFEVINARYNAQKPTIFSSNYHISELADALSLDKAIIERVNEMATRIIKLEGDDFRAEARAEKNSIAKKYGI